MHWYVLVPSDQDHRLRPVQQRLYVEHRRVRLTVRIYHQVTTLWPHRLTNHLLIISVIAGSNANTAANTANQLHTVAASAHTSQSCITMSSHPPVC